MSPEIEEMENKIKNHVKIKGGWISQYDGRQLWLQTESWIQDHQDTKGKIPWTTHSIRFISKQIGVEGWSK